MIRHFLDCSSGHLSPATWTWLDAQCADNALRDPVHNHAELLGGATRYGWFVYASEHPVHPIPDDLIAVFWRARALGCEYVNLDCDAPPLDELPVLHPDFAEAPVTSAEPRAT